MSSKSESKVKKFTLKTLDDQLFEVEEAVVMEFKVLKKLYDDKTDIPSDTEIPLPNVSSHQLVKIIEYCKAHLGFRSRGRDADNDARAFDERFVKELNNEELKEMLLAVNYLNVEDLLDILCQRAADKIKNKSVQYVRRFLGITNDFTPEEEERLRNENAWAFEGVDPDEFDECA